MRLIRSALFLSMILISFTTVAEKRSIVGAGIASKLPAGTGFSLALASSNARVTLQKQTMLSQFTFVKDTNSITFTKHINGKISAAKKVSHHFTKDNITVIMKAETEFNPAYKNEICKTSRNTVSTEDELNQLDSNLIIKTISGIIKAKNIKQGVISGLAYTSDLKIKTNRNKSLTLISTVCVANLDY